MDNTPVPDTERKILTAARKVFVRKGMHGARMQEIADEAGINKALLHYYFRSKDKLFQAIFHETFQDMLPRAFAIFREDRPFEEKIGAFVVNYIDTVSKNHYLPIFVINEINQNPDIIRQFVYGMTPLHQIIADEIQKKVATGEYKPINPVQFFTNIISMTLFPFLSKPLLCAAFAMDEEQFQAFLEERKKMIPDVMISYLKTSR